MLLQFSWNSEFEVLKTRCGNGILTLLGLVSYRYHYRFMVSSDSTTMVSELPMLSRENPS